MQDALWTDQMYGLHKLRMITPNILITNYCLQIYCDVTYFIRSTCFIFCKPHVLLSFSNTPCPRLSKQHNLEKWKLISFSLGGAVGWGTALQAGESRVQFPMVSLEFFIDIILPAALWPWGRLSLLQKWVPGMFPGGKGGGCVRLTTLPPSGADCLEI